MVSPRRLALLLALLMALILLLPLRVAFDALALQENGLSARAIHGSVWRGRIERLSLGDAVLGDVRASLSPLQLLLGRARLDFAAEGDGPDVFRGGVSVNMVSFGLDDVTGTVGLGRRFAPLPVSHLDFRHFSVRFSHGRCVRAQGRVIASLLPVLPGMPVAGEMSGEAMCDGPSLLLTLASETGPERLEVRVDGDRGYHARLTLGAAAPTLLAEGFAEGSDGIYRLEASGRL